MLDVWGEFVLEQQCDPGIRACVQMTNMWKRADFRLHPAAQIALLVAAVSVPLGVWMPEWFGYENGPVENVQLLVLAFGVYFCCSARNHRPLFAVVAMLLVILALREVNCGRTLFFAKPGMINEFYKWKEIPYGWLARVLFGGYVLLTALLFFCRRLYVPMWGMLRRIPVPVWNVLGVVLGMVLGVYGERVLYNTSVEELAELVFYVSLVGGVHLYALRAAEGAEEN